MRDLRQIVRDNGGDDTPALDTHNLTGRAFPEGVEPAWTPMGIDDPEDIEPVDEDFPPYWYDEDSIRSYESWLGALDCE